jgi:hypothetical protein
MWTLFGVIALEFDNFELGFLLDPISVTSSYILQPSENGVKLYPSTHAAASLISQKPPP